MGKHFDGDRQEEKSSEFVDVALHASSARMLLLRVSHSTLYMAWEQQFRTPCIAIWLRKLLDKQKPSIVNQEEPRFSDDM